MIDHVIYAPGTATVFYYYSHIPNPVVTFPCNTIALLKTVDKKHHTIIKAIAVGI